MLWSGLRQIIRQTLDLEDVDFLDIVMATVISVRFPDDPVWMMISGPPGSSKTEVVRMFSGQFVHHVTGATENALVSGCKSKNEDGSTSNNSLLSRLNGKCWIIKDYSEIAQQQKEKRAKFESIMRDAYDGYVNRAFGGANNETGFACHFAIIACCTNAIEIVNSKDDQSAFGQRFITFKPAYKNSDEFTAHVLKMAQTCSDWREMLREYVLEFLNEFEIPDDFESQIRGVRKLANFAAQCRSPIARNWYAGGEVVGTPEVEYGSRIAKQLLLLGRCLNLIEANTQRCLKRVARSCIPSIRYSILAEVYKRTWLRSGDVEELQESVKVGVKTIQFELENLFLLGVLQRTKSGRVTGAAGKVPYTYSITKDLSRHFELMFGPHWMEDEA